MNESDQRHIITALDKGMRFDGRKSLEYRKPLIIEKGFTSTAEGSAKVTLGATEVLVGVKLELGKPYPDSPDQGTIMVGAELLPLSNPEFELGPPGIQAIELARIVDRGIRESGTIDFKKLSITEGEACWIISIDICTLNDAGNLVDASALGAVAALQDMKFPKLEDKKVVFSEKTDKRLKLTCLPITVNVCKIGSHFIIDPTIEEEQNIDARLSVCTLDNGDLCALQKGGDEPLTIEEIGKIIDIASAEGKELRKNLING